MKGLLWVFMLLTMGVQVSAETGWKPFAETLRVPLTARQHEVTLNRQAVSLAMMHKDPLDNQARMEVANTLLFLQEYHQAADWYLRVFTRDAYRSDAAIRFAECLYLSGDVPAALQVIRQLERAGIQHPVLLTLVAEVAYEQQAYDTCLTRLEQAQKALPGHAEPDSPLAMYLDGNLQAVRALVK
jgi:tetratricopeptide (TPR) repeat protein